jgi:hemolysin activation/secretion protein
MNYIDRFDRVEDYNLGLHYLFTGILAPELLGSNHDAILFNATRTEGYRFSRGSFLRADVGVSTRIQESDLVNNLVRVEAKYYNVLGDLSLGAWSLGKHTLATNFYIDYGSELDKDREFLLGADNSLRGYKAKTFTGDKRLALNIEERAHLYDDVLKIMSIGTAIFFDGGGTTNQALGNIFTHEFYSDVGVGLRFGFPRSTNGSVIRMDIAFPLRAGPDGSDRFEPRFLVTGGQVFGSKLRSEIFGADKANVAIGFDR